MIVFWAYAYLSIFSAGIILVLQIQHFALYPLVGKDGFAAYIAANNRAAVFPAILSGLALLVLSVVLLFQRPVFLPLAIPATGLVLNVVNVLSTILWQGRIHGKLARTGYNDDLVKRLVRTIWVRTAALLFQSFLILATLTSRLLLSGLLMPSISLLGPRRQR